jgi:hypothetical protein
MKVNQHTINTILNCFNSKQDDIELEFKFGKLDRNFNSHISLTHFNVLKKYLGDNYIYSEKNILCYDKYRVVNNISEFKKKLISVEFQAGVYDIRFTKSIEKASDKKEFNMEPILRYKKTWTYEFDNYNIDLSIVNKSYECEIEFKQFNLQIKDIFKPIKEVSGVINEYNYVMNMFNKAIMAKRGINWLYYPINKPKNVKKEHVVKFRDEYVFYDKLDGIRFLLIKANNQSWLINQTQVIQIKDTKQTNQTILDVEYYNNEIYAFDILVDNDIDVRENTFMERQKFLNKYINENIKLLVYSNDYNNLGYDENTSDGIIFTPINEGYKNSFTYKYKPKELLTIDFLYINSSINCIDEKGNIIQFKVPFDILKFKQYNNKIIECRFINGFFTPFRIREDKISPNHIDVAIDVYKDIKNPLDIKTIKEIMK